MVEIAGEIRAKMDLRPGQIHNVLDQFLLALAQVVLAGTVSSCAKLIPNSKWYSEDKLYLFGLFLLKIFCAPKFKTNKIKEEYLGY